MNIKGLRIMYEEEMEKFKNTEMHHELYIETIKVEMMKLAKFKVGQKVIADRGKFSIKEEGFIRKVYVGIARWNDKLNVLYIIAKTTRNGKMHKSQNINWFGFTEKEITEMWEEVDVE
jgi:hypothetical protein